MLSSFYAHVLYSEVDELNVQRSVELQSQQQVVDNLQLGLLASLERSLQVHMFLVHGQVTIIFVVSVCLFFCSFVCLFMQSFSQPSSIRFGSN